MQIFNWKKTFKFSSEHLELGIYCHLNILCNLSAFIPAPLSVNVKHSWPRYFFTSIHNWLASTSGSYALSERHQMLFHWVCVCCCQTLWRKAKKRKILFARFRVNGNSPISSAIALNGHVWLVEFVWRYFGLNWGKKELKSDLRCLWWQEFQVNSPS